MSAAPSSAAQHFPVRKAAQQGAAEDFRRPGGTCMRSYWDISMNSVSSGAFHDPL